MPIGEKEEVKERNYNNSVLRREIDHSIAGAIPMGIVTSMAKITLGSHTVKSYGWKMAREHLRDWFILVLLCLIDIVLNSIEPFHRPAPRLCCPGIAFSCLVTGVTTDSIKDAVDWPRPNFFYRCFPDGKPKFDPETRMLYHGVKKIIKEGYKSFPSGHTSWSFAGLTFLACYLSEGDMWRSYALCSYRYSSQFLSEYHVSTTIGTIGPTSSPERSSEHLSLLSLISTFFPYPFDENEWSSHDNDTRSGSRVMLDEDVEPGSTYFPHDCNRESTILNFKYSLRIY
ncbi:hypothetical protein HID58_003089 [Brassica napus]|uniref:Phosphatidic acid phosphatase type 2/haloperoxidase domain-containing protein n=1 Tax=Brassica napus TaxID=3708 RepID=A0ABQ8EP51_BRANA|nr:hypothetical protein HID58_003089 [Brassica napus]